MRARRGRAVALLAALLVAAGLAPRILPSSYAANVLVTAALYVVLALAFDLMAGHVGAVSLAAPAFYAMGAYTAGILSTRYDAGFAVTLPAGVAGEEVRDREAEALLFAPDNGLGQVTARELPQEMFRRAPPELQAPRQ